MKTPLCILLALCIAQARGQNRIGNGKAAEADSAESARSDLFAPFRVPDSAYDDPELKKVPIDAKALEVIMAELPRVFANLDQQLDPKERDKIENSGIEIMLRYHHWLCMHIRNRYGLWSGHTKLGQAFHQLGFTDADYSSPIVLNEYWRHVNETPSKLRAEVALRKRVLDRLEEEFQKSTTEGIPSNDRPNVTPRKTEQIGADQPATAVKSKAEAGGNEKPKPESEARSQ